MGHTLVAAFSEESDRKIRELLRLSGAEKPNKVPFGRNCDRNAANKVLGYHATIFHWPKPDDEKYLSRLKDFRFRGACTVIADRVMMEPAEENSLFLYLPLRAGEGFSAMESDVHSALGSSRSRVLHVTLAISQDHAQIEALYHRIQEQQRFPITLTVTRLELYKIWTPTKLIRVYQ